MKLNSFFHEGGLTSELILPLSEKPENSFSAPGREKG
jgi:hypothetical protein